MIPQMPAKQTRPPVSKSPSAPASSKEKTEMMIDFYDQIPQGPDDPLLARRVLKLFGLRIAWSSYRRHVPATSGAPVGITDSTWIYTAKWAYGRGRVSDWALLQNIEIKIGPAAPIASETGTFELQPPVSVFQKDLEIRIHNRNSVDAIGRLWLYDDSPTARKVPVFAVVGTDTSLALEFGFAVLANTQKLLSIMPARPIVLRRVRYVTEPSIGYRKARIFGRPEWRD